MNGAASVLRQNRNKARIPAASGVIWGIAVEEMKAPVSCHAMLPASTRAGRSVCRWIRNSPYVGAAFSYATAKQNSLNGAWSKSGMTCTKPRASSATADPRDILAAFVGLLATGVFIAPLLLPMVSSPETEDSVGTEQIGSANTSLGSAGYMIAGYFGYPHFLRSNVHLTRSNGTDLQLHNLSWDGEPFFPPFYGGARVMRWGSRFGTMIDLIHNKAVAQLGKGGHGRKIKDPIVEEVEATGTFKNQPAPATIKLNEILDRLEFTHGHNTLLFTGLMRLGSLSPRVKPYVGIGIGAAIPHVEIWLKGEPDKTNEYQLAGPAVQALAGLEFQLGRISYFIEYKFTLAWNRGELTGGESWFNADLPGDLWRQAKRWWIAEKPKYGGYSTILAAHQLVGGVGVRLMGTAPRLP